MGDAPPVSVAVNIKNITKTYGNFHALNDVSLDISAGEFVTLLGPSGSGKTTLLMTLAGFVRPDSGSITFDNKEIVTIPPHKRNIGMVFQNYALFPHMSTAENVAFPLKLRKVGKSETAERVKKALDLVELGHLGDRQIDQLSGGQRQRVALARAIVFEPRILLMDEPLSALDKKLRETMQIEIRRLHEKLGMTTVYVTHDQREALTMSDRIAVMNNGQFAQIATPTILYERPTSHFVADFIGESTFLPVTLRDGSLFLGEAKLETDSEISDTSRDYLLAVKSDRLEVVVGTPDNGSMNVFSGKIIENVYQGESSLLNVELPTGQRILVRMASRRVAATTPNPGDQINLGLHPEDTIIVAEDNS